MSDTDHECGHPDPGMIASRDGMRARDPWEMEQRKTIGDQLMERSVVCMKVCEGLDVEAMKRAPVEAVKRLVEAARGLLDAGHQGVGGVAYATHLDALREFLKPFERK